MFENCRSCFAAEQFVDIRVQRLKSRSCLHDKIFKFGIKIFRLGNTIVEVIFYEET